MMGATPSRLRGWCPPTQFAAFFVGALAWLFLPGTASAQLTVDVNATNSELEDALEGPGVSVGNGTLSPLRGINSQYGLFEGGADITGAGPTVMIDRGVFLATAPGNASPVRSCVDYPNCTTSAGAAILGPNDSPSVSGLVSGAFSVDPQLATVDAGAGYDTAALQLEVTPGGSYLKFSFVFASDEYPEFVCTIFNDAFGFFIRRKGTSTWQNVALLPGTSTPIAVNTINGGVCGADYNPGTAAPSFNLSNSALYVNNGDGSTPLNNSHLQYDAFSIPIVVDAAVTAGATYEVKLVIADSGDANWDSAIFLKWISSSNFANDADIEVDLVVDDNSPSAGDTVTFTLDIANTGQDAAAGAQVAFPLPAGFTWVSDTSGGNYNPSTGVWTVPGTLAATGGSQSIDIVAEAGGSGAVDAFAELSVLAANDVDSSPGNGAAPTVAEDDEAVATLNVTALDRSDAPVGATSYGEATHDIVSGIQLGAAVDADAVSIANADATGDGTDDDGVTFPLMTQGQSLTIPVGVTQATGNSGYLQAFIDWNGDGDFADAGEQVATDMQSAGAGTTIINVPVTVPSGATTSQTFARFRWSTTQGLDATSAAPDGEVEDYAITIEAAGIELTGTVFFDTGTGTAATAHDGLVEGDEAGGGGVTVQLVNTGTGEVIDATETDGAGGYGFVVPATLAGADVTVRAVLPGETRHISSAATNMTDTSTLDGEARATLAPGTAYTADFGLAPASRLVEGQSATVAPGGVAQISHTFTAGTAMDVDFAITGLDTSSAGSFTTTLWRDDDCSGDINAAEAVLPGTQSLAAGEVVCLVARVEASDGLASGATVSFDVLADAVLSGTAETEQLANTDRVTVNDGASLTLTKQVCNTSTSACDVATGAGFGTNNRGAPGELLVYRLVFENPTGEPLEDVRVYDRTPDYSATIAGGASMVTQPTSVSCSLVQPASPVPAGFEGVVEWNCPGQMAAGDRGIASFTVEIAQ